MVGFVDVGFGEGYVVCMWFCFGCLGYDVVSFGVVVGVECIVYIVLWLFL